MEVVACLLTNEALDYSLVDEIADLEDEPAPRLTDTFVHLR